MFPCGCRFWDLRTLSVQLQDVCANMQAAVFQVTSILGAGLVLFMSRGGADDYDDGYTAF